MNDVAAAIGDVGERSPELNDVTGIGTGDGPQTPNRLTPKVSASVEASAANAILPGIWEIPTRPTANAANGAL